MFAQETPTLKVTTRNVQVNVVVVDRKGVPVDGLTRSDFELFDEGKPQAIQGFRLDKLSLPAVNDPLPSGLFSNRLARKMAVQSSVSIVLFDSLNTRAADQMYAQRELRSFVQQMQPQDRVALYWLNTSLRVVHDFTSDASKLLTAVDRRRAEAAAALEASDPDSVLLTGDETFDAYLREASQRMADFYQAQRTELTLAALEAIAGHVKHIPGRKNLIWITGGVPFSIGLDAIGTTSGRDIRIFSREIERAARLLSESSIAVYPVDARGLFVDPGIDASKGGMNRASRSSPNPAASPMSAIYNQQASMMDLAERTGGEAFFNRNDLSRAVRIAAGDARLNYTLSYAPDHGRWDGRYRKLRVKVKRSGLSVRHRSGYFALAAEKPDDEAERQRALREAVQNPFENGELTVNARASRTPVKEGEVAVLLMQVDPAELEMRPQDGRSLGVLDILVAQETEGRAAPAATSDRVRMNLTPETLARVRREGLIFTQTVRLAEKARRLRVVVRDHNSGRVGTLDIPVEAMEKRPAQ